MGRDERDRRSERGLVIESVKGHDSTIAHSFNHTDGVCPKCGCSRQSMMFCLPGSQLPRLRSCELDGEHIHRICAQCFYPWIERPLDHAMLAEKNGDMVCESEFACVLACLLNTNGEITLPRDVVVGYRGWKVHFERDGASEHTTMSAVPADPQTGTPAIPHPGDGPPGGEQ